MMGNIEGRALPGPKSHYLSRLIQRVEDNFYDAWYRINERRGYFPQATLEEIAEIKGARISDGDQVVTREGEQLGALEWLLSLHEIYKGFRRNPEIWKPWAACEASRFRVAASRLPKRHT